MEGEVKNVVDALRRALQGPASTLAAGTTTAGGSFTISLQPNSFTAPQGSANSYQSTIDVASQGGFNGLVTLTETDTLTAAGSSIGIPTNTVQVAPPSPSNDGLVPLNVNVGASTPTGSYTVTVTGSSTINGLTSTVTATLTVVVGSGGKKCVNNSDCGVGNVCSGGQCYTPVDNTLIHTGPCVARDTSICSAETGTAACTGPDGNCYCASTKAGCASQDCSKQGPCSAGTLLNNCICGCTDCVGSGTPMTVSCPTEIDGFNIGVSNTATGSFVVTNNDPRDLNVTMSIVQAGTPCSCCSGAGPSLSTGGGYILNSGVSQTTIITVPFTCTTLNQCYSYNLKINAQRGVNTMSGFKAIGGVVQTFTCPVKFCLKPCSTTGTATATATGCLAWCGFWSITDGITTYASSLCHPDTTGTFPTLICGGASAGCAVCAANHCNVDTQAITFPKDSVLQAKVYINPGGSFGFPAGCSDGNFRATITTNQGNTVSYASTVQAGVYQTLSGKWCLTGS